MAICFVCSWNSEFAATLITLIATDRPKKPRLKGSTNCKKETINPKLMLRYHDNLKIGRKSAVPSFLGMPHIYINACNVQLYEYPLGRV